MRKLIFLLSLVTSLVHASESSSGLTRVDLVSPDFAPSITRDKQGKAIGPWRSAYEALGKATGIEFNFVFLTIERLDKYLDSHPLACSVALVKTPERLKTGIKFLFPLPIAGDIYYYFAKDMKAKYSDLSKLQGRHIHHLGVTAGAAARKLSRNVVAMEEFGSSANMLVKDRIQAIAAAQFTIEPSEYFKSGAIVRGPLLEKNTYFLACSPNMPLPLVESLKKFSTLPLFVKGLNFK